MYVCVHVCVVCVCVREGLILTLRSVCVYICMHIKYAHITFALSMYAPNCYLEKMTGAQMANSTALQFVCSACGKHRHVNIVKSTVSNYF